VSPVVPLQTTVPKEPHPKHIRDLPHNDAYGVENSFFDQAAIRYPGRIRLREHFRCMPEIIQFSNNLCYASEPLIPLRQYGTGRLTPVVVTRTSKPATRRDVHLESPILPRQTRSSSRSCRVVTNRPTSERPWA